MQREELLKQLGGTIGKTKVVKLSQILEEQNFALHDLIDLTFYEDKTIAFRAAWLLENFLLKNPEAYLPEMDYLLARAREVTYPSCQRHYAKILMHLTSRKMPPSIKSFIKQADMEPIVEKLFDWMIDPRVLVAVKVFAGDTLFHLRARYPWISGELADQVQYLMRNGTAAMQSRGRKLLEQLSRG